VSRSTSATDEDWAEARRAWAAGASYRAAAEAIGNRASMGTVRRRAIEEGWQRDDGMPAAPTPEEIRARTAAGSAATQRKFAERRGELIEEFANASQRLLREAFAPHTYREAKVVAGPTGAGSGVEIVDIDLPAPSPADKQKLVTSAAIALDKALLLAGEATSRTETGPTDRAAAEERVRQIRDELAARRDAAGQAGAGRTMAS
jgi:hypothetical protein